MSDIQHQSLQAVTLCDGDYHLPTAALANSLYAAGYRGTLWVGYRGPLPPWIEGEPIAKDPFPQYEIARGFRLGFVPVAPGPFIAHAKPNLLQDLRAALPEAAGLAFFDADSVVTSKWSYFEDWIEGGVAAVMCASHGIMPSGHPWRSAWKRLARDLNFTYRDLNTYVLGGFLALPRTAFGLLDTWVRVNDLVLERHAGELGALKHADPLHAFVNPEQNSLNLAMMASEVPLALAGPEAASQTGDIGYFSTAISGHKAWRGGQVWHALKGHPPSLYDRLFWHWVGEGPVRAVSAIRHRNAILALAIAALIARFYRRS